MNESLALANYITGANYGDIPGRVVDITKKTFLDALGVILAAGTLGEGCREFIDLAMAAGGKKESTVIGFETKIPVFMAAFANGSMSHALDFEDTHDGALVHSNAATIPAALAVAESIGNVGGRELITAIALGSDIVCRLGLALNENPFDQGWYIAPILGSFGAATAACKLMNLTAGQILDAFSLTLCQTTCSAELAHSPNSIVRSIRDAFSAKTGVLSALLAKKGVTGFNQPIEGRAGLYSLYARGNFNPDTLTGELGKTFEGENVSFKPWPSCRGTHPYLDAFLKIMKTDSLSPGDVEEIVVVVSPLNKMLCEPPDRKQNPATAIDAKFSIPFVLATALTYGGVTLDHFTTEALTDQNVLDAARKVKYKVDRRLTLKESMQGYLQVTTKGQIISKEVDYPYGHPKNPIGKEALVLKFMDCARHSAKKFSQQDLNRIVELILNLEEVQSISEITHLL